jgi:hypothetical protein
MDALMKSHSRIVASRAVMHSCAQAAKLSILVWKKR